jgi:2-polyprenyl-3-methyl-5-hydroxy-6-metoxy-1,4-benzoquinol methylase
LFSGSRFDKLLDLGCSDGYFSLLLKEASGASEVFGIDIDGIAVKKASKRGVNAIQMDLDKADLPFRDKSFDGILASEVIEHLINVDHFLDEVRRVLKDDGLFVVTTPNLASWINRLSLLIGLQPLLTEVSLRYDLNNFLRSPVISKKRPRGHLRAFTYGALKYLLEMHGLYIEKTIGVCMPTPFPSYVLDVIDRLFSRRTSMSSLIIFACRKKYLKFHGNRL